MADDEKNSLLFQSQLEDIFIGRVLRKKMDELAENVYIRQTIMCNEAVKWKSNRKRLHVATATLKD